MIIQAIPLTETFPLESAEDVSVTIRQAREGEYLERQDFFSKITRVYEDDLLGAMGLGGRLKVQVEQNEKRLRRKEAYLVLGRVTGVLLQDGTELFRSQDSLDGATVKAAMSEDEFNRAWNMLPPAVALEISRKVRKVNKDWGAEGEGE